jgi:hypothetical protein
MMAKTSDSKNQLDVIIQECGIGMINDRESKLGCHGPIAMQSVFRFGRYNQYQQHRTKEVEIHASIPIEPRFYSEHEPIFPPPTTRL